MKLHKIPGSSRRQVGPSHHPNNLSTCFLRAWKLFPSKISLRVPGYHPPYHSMSPSPSVTLGGVASARTRKLRCVTRIESSDRACLVMRDPCKCCQRQEEMKRTPSYRVTSRSWRLQVEVKQENAPQHPLATSSAVKTLFILRSFILNKEIGRMMYMCACTCKWLA